MTVKLETYYNISEKEKRLAEIYRKYGDRALFMVPGGLDKELLVHLISEDGSFFGKRPAVWTWSDLYRELSRCGGIYRRVIDPPDHNLIISYVLKNYLSGAGESGDLPPGVIRRGFSSVLGDNIRELLNEEIFPDRMRELLNIEEDDHKTPEAILCRLYGDYLSYLEENEIADSAQIPTLTRQMLDMPQSVEFVSGRAFVFVGFLTFTGGQRKLIDALGAVAGECRFILPETGLDDYYDGIKQLGAEYRNRPEWSVNVLRLLAYGEHMQFESLARELALWLKGAGGLRVLGGAADYGEIGVMVEPRHLRILQNSLTRYKIPHSAQVRENAGETLAGHLLRELWDAWVSGWETRKTFSLLANPLLGGEFNAAAYTGKFPEGREAWLATLSGAARARFVRVEKVCQDFERGGTPPEILALWRDFLKELRPGDTLAAIAGEEISLDGVIRDIGAVIHELDKKIEILRDLKRDIGAAADIKLTGGEAVAYVSDWSRTAKLPISLPQSRSVAVYAGPPPVLGRHKYWIMTGVDYNSWPGTLRESPLLSDAGKKILNGGDDEKSEPGDVTAERPHIPEIYEQRQQKEALFRRLLATAERGVILTRTATDHNGRPVGDSQFTEELFNRQTIDKDRTYNNLGRIEYPASRMLPRPGDMWFPQAEALSAGEKLNRGDFPRNVRSTSEKEKIYVPLSSLDEWNKCPYLYWCRRKARMDTPRRDVYDPLRGGTLMHKLWEVCWKERLEKDISVTQLVITRWNDIVRQEYHELMTDQRLRRYGMLLYKQAIGLAEVQDAIESRAKERVAVEIEYVLPEYEADGVVFVGRADRIDFFEGGAVVLDYKAGRSSAYKKDLQLAAYAAVLREKAGLEPYGYGWFGLRDSALSGFWNDLCLPVYREKARSNKGFETRVDEALETMHRMAHSLREGIFRANYANPGCPGCEFATLCRRKEYPLYQLEDEAAGEENGDE